MAHCHDHRNEANRYPFNNCFYSRLRIQWGDTIYTIPNHSPVYCGKFVENLDEPGENAADALAEMTLFAVIDRPKAILTLFSAFKNSNRVSLNIDITYYLQFYLEKLPPLLEAMARRYRSFSEPEAYMNIVSDRKNILDTAFANGDHLKIFELTAPCQGS